MNIHLSHWFRSILLSLVGCLTLVGCASLPSHIQAKPILDLKPTLILISLDGFRPDYLEKFSAPTLKALANEGVQAQALESIFPTQTFPNHYSIVTGLYPDHHGIVGNSMRDPRDPLNEEKEFKLGHDAICIDPYWWLGEPIWITAQKQGQLAGTIFWPGSNVEISGIRPKYWEPYSPTVSKKTRVYKILEWLDLPQKDRPTFLTLYFQDTDVAGHAEGPDSNAVKLSVSEVDSAIAELVSGLRARQIENQVNMIFTSDHGITQVHEAIRLDSWINSEEADIVGTGPFVQIFPKGKKGKQVFEKLRHASSHMKVYRKFNLPKHFRMSKSERTGPIVLVADEHYYIVENSKSALPKGGHGYDPKLASMKALFFAHGPAFKKSSVVPEFSSIHLYELMAKILNLNPAPNDGKPSEILRLLKSSSNGSATPPKPR